jgi:hypothetical protein
VIPRFATIAWLQAIRLRTSRAKKRASGKKVFMSVTPVEPGRYGPPIAEPQTRDTIQLEFGAQALIFFKVIAGLVLLVGVTLATVAFMIWLSPSWAKLF